MGPWLLLLVTGLWACGDKDTGEVGDGGAVADGGSSDGGSEDGGRSEGDGGSDGDGGSESDGGTADGGSGDGGSAGSVPVLFEDGAYAGLIGQENDGLGGTVLLHDLDGDAFPDLLATGKPDPSDVYSSGCMILPGPLTTTGLVAPADVDLHVVDYGYEELGSGHGDRALAVPDWNGDG